MAQPSNLHTFGSRTDDAEAVDTDHLDDVMGAVFHDTEAVYYPDSGDDSETDLLHGYDTEVVPDSDEEFTDSNENKGCYRRNASLFERLPVELHKVESRSHPLCKKLDKSNTDIDACVDERHASCLAADINGGNGATPIIVHCDMQATNLRMQDNKMPMIKDPCQTDSCDVSCSEDVKQMCMESKVENNGKLSQSNSREVRLVYTCKTNRLLNLEDKRTEDVKRLIDDSNDYGGLSYVESQEPEDVSSALLFVDQYLCVNAMQLPSSPLSVVKTKQTSPPALSAKGTQSLVRWTGVRNSEKKAGIFEWNDSLDGDKGYIPSDDRNQRQLAFRGRKYNHTYVRRSPSVKNSFLTEEGHKKDREDSEGNLDQQAAKASLLKKTEISAIPEDSELDYDIGIGTQIAVEAIQALSSAVSIDCSEIDVNQCPQSLPDMPSEDTQKQMHAGVWSFPKKARSEYTETPDSNFSSKGNFFDHPVEKMQASKQVPRKDGGKLTAAKCMVGRSSADTDKVKLTKRAKAYRAKKASKDGCKENLDRPLSNEDKPLYKLKNKRRVKNSNRATTNLKSSSLFNMQEGLVSEALGETVADLKFGSLDKEKNRGITDMLDFSAENVNSSKNFSNTSLNTRNLKLNDEDRKSFVVDDPSTDVLVPKKRDQMDCLHDIGKEGSRGSNEISAWSANWGLRDYPRGKRTCRSLLDRSEGYSDLVNLSVKIREEKPNLYPLKSQMNAETQSFSSGFKRKRRSTIYISPCLWSSKKYEQCFLMPPISELKKNGSLYDNDYNAKKDEVPSEQLTKNTIAVDVTNCKANENMISDDVAFTSCQTFTSQMNSMNLVDGYSKQHGKIKPSPTALTRELSRLGFKESMPEFTPKTSRRRKTMANIRVLFSQNLDESTRKHQMKILMRFGVPIATSPSNATHFVTDRFARTRNMMEIIARGKPVVTHQWLESCDQAGFYIDERDYIVRDAKKEQEFGFRLPISLDRARQRPILKDYRVFITLHAKPGKEMLAGLVKAVHGKVLNVVKDNDLDNLLILSCDEDHAHCIPLLRKGAEAYDPELLLNGIIIQKLEFARHKLFSA